ncbi:MAG: hypothetical protein K2Y40_05465 [Reyranella sp.]|jgi:hypothetical protein|nr:hypothetical protein [Reyranella sp.]
MNRRAFVFASLAASAALAPAHAAPDLKVIYVGGWDCPPCTQWKNAYKAKWLASPEFRRVTWIEVDPPKLKEAYQERYWPGELKPILEQIPRKSGTPRFLIVSDGRIVSNQFGGGKWPETMADLRKILEA